ncbi:MAG: hypothetical protein J0H98_02330 [Solirubrobacterales bacterium]|nr:hypothetical protein [Solirubrobacterales bacterium]
MKATIGSLMLTVALLFGGADRAAALQDFPLPTGDAGLIDANQGPHFGNRGIISWRGSLWFAEEDANKIGVATTGGQISEVTIPSAISEPEYGPFALSAVRNDQFWFAADGAPLEGRVVRLSPELNSNYWNLGYNKLLAIVADPAGGAWVTYDDGEGISYYDNDNVEHYFEEPQYLDPGPITVGGDGAAWFGDGSSTIKRITKSGSLTNYHASGDGDITSITTGPDGSVWYSKFNPGYGIFGPPASGGVIGRMTLSGSPKLFEPPVDDLLPSSLIAGPDGAIWFTTGFGEGIGRVTPAGRYSLINMPGGRTADSIAFGPDGALWYTDSRLNRIGRMTIPEFNRATAARKPQILSRSLRANRRGVAKLRIACPVGPYPCHGNIAVAAGRKAIGKGWYSLPIGKTRSFAVRLNGPGKKLLRRKKTLAVKVTLKPANAKPVSRKMKLRR